MSDTLQRTIARIDRAKKIDPGAWAAETEEAFQRRSDAFRAAKLAPDLCGDCPAPRASGEPQPMRCNACPYHGYVIVRRELEDGRREISFVKEQPS